MSRFTKRITAMLLAGMLVIGSAPGSVFAASTDVDPSQTSEIAEEVYGEDTSEAPAAAEKTTQIEETSEAPVGAGEGYSEEALAEEEAQYYTVTLNANGGYFENEWDDALGYYTQHVEVVEKHIPVDGTVVALPVFTDQEGQTMVFAGWSLEKDGELITMGDKEYAPVDNCTLYALWKVENAALEETERQEVAEENSEQADAAQEPKGVDAALGDTVVIEDSLVKEESSDAITSEEGNVTEDAASEFYTDPETESEQAIVDDQEAAFTDEDLEITSEESSDAAEAEGETQLELIESSEEEAVREDAANGLVASGTCGDSLSWTLDEAGTLTISGTGEMYDYNYGWLNWPWYSYRLGIKTIVIEKGVASIGDSAFFDCNNLISITIPEELTSIGDYAFRSCSSLIDITIPKGVTIIGHDTFYDCSSLTSITIAEGVTSIGDAAFKECSSLENITIPSTISSIGNDAFENCSSLTDIAIPESMTTIGDYAFYSCSSLTSITIPSSVSNIGKRTFYQCKSLASVVISDGVSSIGESAFYACSKLTSITIPSSVKGIADGAFSYCRSLTSITIAEGVTSIGDSAFKECSSLTNITIPSSMSSIGKYAFDNCSSLTSITISSSGTTIGNYAFNGCNAINIIKVLDIFAWINYYDCFDYGFSLKDLYIGNVILKELIIPEGLTSIPDHMFSGIKSLEDVTIPEGVMNIEKYAFYGCKNLKNITIPSSMSSIGDCAFEKCSSLTSITIPSSVNTIGNQAFYDCSSLTNITIPSSVTAIGYFTFKNCSSLTSITIPSSVTTIGNNAFDDCTSLTNITIPSSVTSIGESVFKGCNSLTDILIPPSITSIGDCTFYYCTSLKSVMIPKSVIRIGDRAFESCHDLTDVYYAGMEDDWNTIKIGIVNSDLTKATIHYSYEQDKIVISLDPNYEITIDKQFIISADVTSMKVIPDSSNMSWILTPSDGQEPAITWGTMTVQTGEEGKYQISVPVTIAEAGKYKLSVEFEGISAQSIVNVNDKNKIQPTFELSTDTVTFQNESLGEKLQLTLKAENVLLDASLSQEQKNALCFHVDSIDFEIEGTPAAYFNHVGDEYTQKYAIVPLDDEFDIPIGKEKQFADFEIHTNPPVVISDPVQRAEIIYTIKGTIDGKTIELSDKKTVKFLYDFNEEEPRLDYIPLVDEWVNNEGTRNSIKYLTNSSNFIHYIFVTEKDSGVGGKVTKTLSDLFYRGVEGRQELGADKLSEQEAEQILIDFLNDNEEDIYSIANIIESTELGSSIAEGFKVYLEAVKDDLDPGHNTGSFYDALYDELVDHLINDETISAGAIKTLAGESNKEMRKLYDDYLQSILFTEKVTKVLGTVGMIGKGVKLLSVSLDTVQQMKEVEVLRQANKIYVEMLDYLDDQCQYSPVKNAARSLSQIFKNNMAVTTEYINSSLKGYIYETVLEDVVVVKTVDIISKFAKASNKLKLSVISAEVGFKTGVLFSNIVFHTKENQELKDRMRILTAIGDTLGTWIEEGLVGYSSSGGMKKIACARHIAYGEHILIKTRKLGEIAYQRLCESVDTESCEAYRVSKCITSTLETIEKWFQKSDILGMVAVAGVYCPVDVDVCDESGNIIFTISDGKESSGKYGDIQYWSIYNKFDDDYMKIVTYPAGKNYSLRCHGRREGELSAFYQEYDNDGCSHCITFEDIPVKSDMVITLEDLSTSSEQFTIENDGVLQSYTYEKTVRDTGIEHSFTDWTTDVEPKCEVTGFKSRTCIHCGKTEVELLPAIEHIWDTEYTVDTVPTDDQPGAMSVHCKVCDAIKKDSGIEIPALNNKDRIINSGSCGKSATWTLYNGGLLFISGTGAMTYSSTLSSLYWNEYKPDIKTIIINKGVTSIAEGAFSDCTNLSSIIIPEGITIITSKAFRNCTALTSVIIPSTVTQIQTYSFRGCTSLESVKMAEGIERINSNAFSGCSSLNSVTIPSSLIFIAPNAFSGCDNLRNVYVSDNLTRNFYSAFKSTPWISSMGDFVIVNDILWHYNGNESDVVIPSGVKVVGKDAFGSYSNLESVIIPTTVNNIGENAFKNCTGLTSVIIPENVERINYHAFSDCTSLENVEIKKGVTIIGKGAFQGCVNLTDVKIPDSVSIISETAFYNCKSLVSVDIPSSVTTIENAAFEKCSSLNKVLISDGVTSIGNSSFSGCISLAEITIPGSVTIIGKFAYCNCDSLTNITIPSSVNSIGERALCYEEDNEYYPLKNVIISGFYNSYAEQYAKENGFSFRTFIVDAAVKIPEQTYTGKALKPVPEVSLGENVLSNTADYTVSYNNNTNAGTATVTITGIGNYAGTKTTTFKINKAAQSITAKAKASSVAVGKITTVSISGAKGKKSFKSSNTAVATVSSTGKVTAKKVGKVTITATSAATSNYKAASKTVTIKVVPAATASLKADNQATGIKLTWKKVAGANGYKVYRGSTLIKTITNGSTVSFVDKKANTNGTKYNYKVVAKATTGDSTLSRSRVIYRVSRPAVSSVKNSASKKMTVTWGKNAKATGYQIQYSTNKSLASGNNTATVTKAATVSKAIGSLTKGKTYYVRIRTYKTVGSTKYWSTWSAAKSVKIAK